MIMQHTDELYLTFEALNCIIRHLKEMNNLYRNCMLFVNEEIDLIVLPSEVIDDQCYEVVLHLKNYTKIALI